MITVFRLIAILSTLVLNIGPLWQQLATAQLTIIPPPFGLAHQVPPPPSGSDEGMYGSRQLVLVICYLIKTSELKILTNKKYNHLSMWFEFQRNAT